jgi:autotransporter-associated beta strand protein
MVMPFMKKTCVVFLSLFLNSFLSGQVDTRNYIFGTHFGYNDGTGNDTPVDFDVGLGAGAIPSSPQLLYLLNSSGTSPAAITASSGNGANQFDGGLIELGFFDTDLTNDGTESSIAPNTNTTNLFVGQWTPLTSLTRIGQDWGASNSDVVGAGEFYFDVKFDPTSHDGRAYINAQASGYEISDWSVPTTNTESLGEAVSSDNNLADRVAALDASGSTPLIGIRFYDSSSAAGARYNTIMSPNWDWLQAADISTDISLHDNSGNLRSDLYFEFDNTDYGSVSYVGTGGSNDVDVDTSYSQFVATVTFYDGTGNLDLDNTGGIGDSVLSGLHSGGNIEVGDDGNVLTIHSATGNDFTYSGNIGDTNGTATGQASIVKTGTGSQTLTGKVNLGADTTNSTSGLLDIYEGTLSLDPTSSGTMRFEYLKNTSGGSGTPILELNNTVVDTGELVQFAFGMATSGTFSGNVVLDGNKTDVKVKISNSTVDGNFSASDYGDKQTISGVISHATGNKTLVKDGTGILDLNGTNTFTGGLRIEDGTLIAGSAQALGNTSPTANTVTINKGKLEVANGVTLNSNYTLATATGESNKTMIGGRGDLSIDVTVGSADTNGFVDVISPGDGISSSLSNDDTQQQVSLGDRTNAIGEFTVGGLTLEDGGVYDWEISDFTNAGDNSKAGVDWDLLKFDSLTFDYTTDTVTLNIMGLASDGTAGAMGGSAEDLWGSYQGTNGFLFMEGSWAGGPSAGTLSTGFTIQDDGWQYYNSHSLNEWSVYWDGTSRFYLQYSAVPEPSTYMMVTGLLMVPGVSYVRRLRKKKDPSDSDTIT